ncbi:MAG: OFA family MFS transporter [Planctomycetaceae bacterium]|nr:OFA family MFS transporter [Planctomycetaceae bacterium]
MEQNAAVTQPLSEAAVSGPNRTLVFAASYFIIFCCAAPVAFSVFDLPMQAATGGTASQVALTLTIFQFMVATFALLSGKIMDGSGPKTLMYVGAFVFGLGWIITAYATSLPVLYFAFGVLAGAGNGILYNTCIATALRWYPDKRGTMSGILLSAASFGPLALAKAGAYLCDRFGLQGLVYIGIACMLLIWAVGWVMRVPRPGWQPEGWNTPAPKPGIAVAKEYTAGEMIRTGKFWLLLALYSIACTSGIMLMSSLSRIGQTQLGMTALAAANLVVFNCLANFTGRIGIGKLCDKLGEVQTLTLVLVATIVGLFGLRYATSMAMYIPFMLLLGAAFGGILVIFPPLTYRAFGLRNAAANYGTMFFGYSIGTLIGPQISALFINPELGALAYANAYIVASGVAGLGIVLSLNILKKKIA